MELGTITSSDSQCICRPQLDVLGRRLPAHSIEIQAAPTSRRPQEVARIDAANALGAADASELTLYMGLILSTKATGPLDQDLVLFQIQMMRIGKRCTEEGGGEK
jgi:hypothetical protein